MAKRMAHRDSYHMEKGFKGSKGTVGRSSGSHAHIGERHGPGEVSGAGEIGFLGAPNTGSSKESRAVMGAAAYPSTKTPAPGKPRTARQNQEE